ncbi:MAG: hypothetical protein GF381_04750 [Candidatus Pacebacteria bacterium]|nr:hypothetical protein [Candidatus Paceibacterota bacterium]
MTSAELSEINNLVSKASSVLVILSSSADFDQQLAAASLYLQLKEREQDLQVEFLSPSKIDNHTIAGFDKLKTEMGKNNLVISFDYDEQAVGNVSYNIDEQNKKFYLAIKPKKGQEPLSTESVDFEYVGADADVIFLVGVEDLESLEQLYFGYESLYQKAAVVDISSNALDIAQFYQSPNDFCCTSEAVLAMLEEWGARLSPDQATNLYAGIQYGSDNFVSLQASAQTFEWLADLLKAGARRSGRAFQKAGKLPVKSGIIASPQTDHAKPKKSRQEIFKISDKSDQDDDKQDVGKRTDSKQDDGKLDESPSKSNKRVDRPSGLRR